MQRRSRSCVHGKIVCVGRVYQRVPETVAVSDFDIRFKTGVCSFNLFLRSVRVSHCVFCVVRSYAVVLQQAAEVAAELRSE